MIKIYQGGDQRGKPEFRFKARVLGKEWMRSSKQVSRTGYCQKFYENHGMRHERIDPEDSWKKDERFSRENNVSVRIFPDGEGISVAKQHRSFTVL